MNNENFEKGDLVRLHPRKQDIKPVLGFIKHSIEADLGAGGRSGQWLHVFLLNDIGNVWNQGETIFVYAGPDAGEYDDVSYDVFIVAKHDLKETKLPKEEIK